MAVRNLKRRRRNEKKSSILLGCCLLAISLVVCAHIITSTKDVPVKDVKTTYVAEYDTVAVPVPVMTVPSGTKVSTIQVKNIMYPRHQLPQGALLSLASVQDAVTTTILPANLPFFRENLSFAASQGNPVIEQIPQGMRAITIRVDVTSAVEGWASSGSIVDVLLVEKDRTSVIAEQVKILSAERMVKPLENIGTPTVPSTVTLLVTQQQALALTTAVPRGKISFALRSKQDAEDWFDKDFTPEKLRGHFTTSNKKKTFKGYVAVKTEKGEKKFALTEDGWVKSDVRPKQFLPVVED